MRSIKQLALPIIAAVTGFALINAARFSVHVDFAIVGIGGAVIGLYVCLCSALAECVLGRRVGLVGNMLFNMLTCYAATMVLCFWAGVPVSNALAGSLVMALEGGCCAIIFSLVSGPVPHPVRHPVRHKD